VAAVSSTEGRRNERSRQAGWSSRAQERHARGLGYTTPADYRDAKTEARTTRTPVQLNPNRIEEAHVLSSGVVKAFQPEANRRIGVKATRAGTVYGAKGPAQVQALGTILRRTARSRRVAITIDGTAPMGRKGRGFSVGFIRDRWAQWSEENEGGTFEEFLDDLAEEFGYGRAAGAGYVSMTVV